MCQILHHANLEIETIGELRKLMPKLVKDPCYTATPEPIPQAYDDSCLCPLDLIATGAANGFKVEAKDGDYVTREWPDAPVSDGANVEKTTDAS